MRIRIALLTPGLSAGEGAAVAACLRERFGPEAGIEQLDALTDQGRSQAAQALASGRFDVVLSSVARIDPHVLPHAKAPVVVTSLPGVVVGRAADVVATLRRRGLNASLAISWDDAVSRVRDILAPPVLAGKRALIFAEPFDSATHPAPNLSHAYIKERTGVDVQYRPVSQLAQAMEEVDEARAEAEMDRWRAGASGGIEPSRATILGCSKLCLVLKDLVARENLAGISIDCVRHTRGGDPLLPHPCLAFSRLRDEGVAAPCEADVWSLLSELLLEGVAHKPAFMGNVGEVDLAGHTMSLLHCVVPLRLAGYGSQPVPYGLHHYHDLGTGASMEVAFPIGTEVTLGQFSKSLETFSVWPGTIVETGSGACRSCATIRIPDAARFLHGLPSCHYVMVYGRHASEVAGILGRLNVQTVGPVCYDL
ncbi:MAG: hypothetical protein FJW35_18670 [Acidobacteria bacterium]|nr:hypothetical protein [Acidobacteriota bacterium]